LADAASTQRPVWAGGMAGLRAVWAGGLVWAGVGVAGGLVWAGGWCGRRLVWAADWCGRDWVGRRAGMGGVSMGGRRIQEYGLSATPG